MDREIFRNKKRDRFVGKIIVMLIVFCVIAALAEIRLNPKTISTDNVTDVEFQY